MCARWLGAVALVACSACYTYRPMTQPEPVPGQRVSAQLTREGSIELGPQIGPDVLHVEGEVLAFGPDGLDLSVRQVENYRGLQTNWSGERVRLPRHTIAALQERRISVGGTGLIGGLVVGGLYAVYTAIGAGETGGSGPGTGSGSPQ